MKNKKIKKVAATEGTRIKFPKHWQEDFDPNKHPPYFSFRYLAHDGHYCLGACGQEAKASFAETLYTLSQLTWNQIHGSHRHGLGFELIRREQIRVQAPQHLTDDIRKYMTFRFHGLAPMVGYRQHVTYFVLWLDPNMDLYDHG